MNKTLFLIFGMALVSVSASATVALITNGDFEAGNTGFTTSYIFVSPNFATGTSLVPEGAYTVTQTGQTSASFNSSWVPAVGPLSGNSFFLANGIAGMPEIAWQGTATGLIPGMVYTLSGFGVSVGSFSPASLEWVIGTTAIGLSVALPGPTGSPWTQFVGMFVATTTTQALGIRSNGGDVGIGLKPALNTAATGNDFGLDNLTIAQTVPEPGTYALFAAGLVGIAALRRRK